MPQSDSIVTSATLPSSFSLKAKIKDYNQLVKLRLNLTVVMSTFVGYMLGSPTTGIDWLGLVIIVVGGFLTVGAANGINQIIEKESDAKMRRTENRPLAQGRMSVWEAVAACLIMGLGGVWLIGYFCNTYAAILSFISLFLYSFVYTPLKRISPISVYVGAIPGAIPPMIGFVAAGGAIGTQAIVLFIIQFIWQFPHFYSIAWLLDEDYKRAGLRMHPIGAQIGPAAAVQILIFTAILIPVSFLPYVVGTNSIWACLALAVCAAFFTWPAFQLYEEQTNKEAKKLMFGSILYLPVIFIVLMVDKIF